MHEGIGMYWYSPLVTVHWVSTSRGEPNANTAQHRARCCVPRLLPGIWLSDGLDREQLVSTQNTTSPCSRPQSEALSQKMQNMITAH